MPRGRPRKTRAADSPSPPVDPLARAFADAFIVWLESVILGSYCEDFEIVPDHDRGEPADPFLAVHVALAPREERGHSCPPHEEDKSVRAPIRVEIILAIEAANSRFLPDDSDDILRDLHQRIAMPLNPSSDPDDEEGNAPYGDVLEGLRASPGFRLLSLHDVKHPTLIKPPSFDHLVYVGVLCPTDLLTY